MDFLRSQLAIVQDRLAGLTASQRMLAGALVVILVMTMLYWGKIAGSTERVALLSSPSQPEELAQLTATLKAKGIDVTVEGGKVMVPAGREIDAMGEVSFNGLVPASTTNALDAMLDKITPWNTSGQFTARMTSAKQQYLAAILKKWPGVQSVDVVIADTPQASITRRDPNMAVYIQTKSGASVNRRQMAQSARQFVSRSMSGLRAENISIAIDGATIVAGGPENDAASLSNDLLAIKREAERDWLDKLRNQFSPITGILISVNVEVDNSSSVEKRRELDTKNKLVEEQKIDTKSQRPVGPATPQQEPGVIANTAIDAGTPAVSTGPSGVETEESKTEKLIDFGTRVTDTTKPGGTCAIVGATVSVPRSYCVALWRQRQKGADAQKEPTDADVQPLIDSVTSTIRKQVVAVTGIKDESRITVTDISDLEPIVGGPVLAAASTGVGGELQTLATSHAKEVVLGILAVASLFMVSRMVKKAEPIALNVPGLAGAGGLALAGVGVGGGDGILTIGGGDGATKRKPGSVGGEDIAGEVGGDGNTAVMMGQELDPEVLETSQIIEQVSNFVKTNPDQAAQMVSRWMSRD